ncbi:MAG TPA: GntR family transcriptional regulator [Longimicrobiales bacterium]|nr:GntR family transcriptional regulator [Longimicrobiales bacterium]
MRRILLKRLMSGELEPGTQVNELALCEELGVSRTPLREALLRLDFEGFVENQPGKGFIVTPLRPDTAFELHSIVGLLEGLAVRALADKSEAELAELAERLDRANQAMIEAARGNDSPEEELLIELGNAWHAQLVGAWDNRQFQEVLALLKARLYRYTYLFLRERTHVEHTLAQHQEIVDAIRAREIDTAADLMSAHWMSGAEAHYEWLRRSEDDRES